MQIEKAKETGFCFGVRRALKLLDKAITEHGDIEILGPMVHNQQVIDNYSQRGVKVVENATQIKGGTVVIPSHGVSPFIIEELESRKLQIVDGTCPIVQKAQSAARELSAKGFQVIVFGDPAHSEVKGVLGWAGEGGIATLDSREAIEFDELPSRLGFLSQTTQNPEHFHSFLTGVFSSCLSQIGEISIVNTICRVTRKRQTDALELARRVDLMIVVGGRNSANTRHLAEICSSTGVETYHVERAIELEEKWFEGRAHIGVTTGTSTLDQVTQEVVQKLREIGKEFKWNGRNSESI
ncbi:4-hydroxy-3-methylbut-2-enyl diphosphate reductase [Chloroflexota bacterium]